MVVMKDDNEQFPKKDGYVPEEDHTGEEEEIEQSPEPLDDEEKQTENTIEDNSPDPLQDEESMYNLAEQNHLEQELPAGDLIEHTDDSSSIEEKENNYHVTPSAELEEPQEHIAVEPVYKQEQKQSKGMLFWILPMLIGIIIGVAIMVSFDTPLFDSSEPTENEQIENNQGTNEPAPDNPSQVLQVDVTTQVTEVVENVSHAVVGVTNIQIQTNFWEQNDGNETGTGSGVVYKTDDNYAYVVTNHHVIEGADAIEVVLSDETTVEANILGSDIFTDLAVLRMDVQHVEGPIEMGTSSSIKVGEPAIAIGNPLGHMFSGTVTFGVISSKERTIPVDLNQDGYPDWQADVIQTDAAINPGNSGGALINIHGQLIGINSMKINEAAVEGIGFAIPIDTARPIIEELEQTGTVTRAYLGVEVYSLEEVPQAEWNRTLQLPQDVVGGVYVWRVDQLSPAEQGGLKRLDVITELDGHEIHDTIDLRKILYQEKNVGDELHVIFYRDGQLQQTTITLGTQP